VGALAQIDTWDVGAAAAGIVARDGLVHSHGPSDRPFPLASVSKVLASIAVHVAVEEGSISLDEPAGPTGSSVRHLLAHASGLPPDGGRTPLGPPERKRIYSNVGFEVLGEHLAERTGMLFAEYVRLALAEPLGLTSTDVAGSPAHGYASSVDDLCRLLLAVIGGALLAGATFDAMTRPAFPDLAGVLPGYGAQDPNPWGLGVEVRGRKDPHWTSAENSPETWGHFGRAGTFVWWDPAVDLGLVVLTDREFGPWAVEAWPALASRVLAEHT
jgi:CubicO group peptidase (beta-lactamase class C family)